MASSNTNGYFKLDALRKTHDICVGCKLCCRKEAEITFSLTPQQHQCKGGLLLVRQKNSSNLWRPVAQPPPYPKPLRYVVCLHFKEGQGCTSHGSQCCFASSAEEATIWNFLKNTNMDFSVLVDLVKNQSESSEHISVKETILRSFKGNFLQLCEECFHASPKVISEKNCCAGHPWKPIMVFCQQDTYNEIRSLPKHSEKQWQYCKYVLKEQPCLHGAKRCWFAHSNVEMAVWMAESNNRLDPSELLNASVASSGSRKHPQERQYYCIVCEHRLRSKEEFLNHCFTAQHRTRIFEDRTSTWKHRDPPQTYTTHKLCKRPLSCEFGERCNEAHSQEELFEWREREKTALKRLMALRQQGLLSYQDSLLGEYRTSTNKEIIMAECVPEVSISCDSELSISVRRTGIQHKWNFNVKPKDILLAVALLKSEPGATFALGDDSSKELTYSEGDWFKAMGETLAYNIPLSFISDCPGFYEQWLVFDFDTRPVLLQKLRVKVGVKTSEYQSKLQNIQSTDDAINSPPDVHATAYAQIAERAIEPTLTLKPLHDKNMQIVHFAEKPEAEQDLLRRYKPQLHSNFDVKSGEDEPLNHQNYKDKMHSFLYQEDTVQDSMVSRLNLQGTLSLTDILSDEGMRIAPSGELFAAVAVPHSFAPDTPQGFLFKRHVQTVLVRPVGTTGCQPQHVYEACILHGTATDTKLHLHISERCCNDLKLVKNTECEMELHFQLNRLRFCEMHRAIDLLPDLNRVLPNLSNCCVPVVDPSCSSTQNPRGLNQKQQAAMDFILGSSNDNTNVAPLLIYGPFGTGKTHTLATVTVALAEHPYNKILICTHTNSSADLYVTYFHDSIDSQNLKTKPLRIKAKEVPLRTTNDITLKYCHLSKDGNCFEFPSKDNLDMVRIVITTTSMAQYFHDLDLPESFFTHILIDEASQMLECEALMAMGLAGKGTRVVLAGDHMQMGPKIFSAQMDNRSDRSLLNRLFYHYQAEKSSIAKRCRVVFNQNYRSTKDIVHFVSTHFYVGTGDAIHACGGVPADPNSHALQFYHVRGQCKFDTTSMSWFNLDEIRSVVYTVQCVLDNWPLEWQNPDPTSICVLSQGTQVYHIRNFLRKEKLSDIIVENAENVQGKEYRVVVISTVHTKDGLTEESSTCLDFFNDPRVLNTAMTRAQSLVIVVGDAAALCYFGKCSRIWKSYIDHCINKGSAKPENLSTDYLGKELEEISRFFKNDADDNSVDDSESSTSEIPDTEDPILKELLDESCAMQVHLTEEGIFPVLQLEEDGINIQRQHSPERNSRIPVQKMIQSNSEIVKQCELVIERFNFGYARPLDNPTMRIEIKGRTNLGQSFPGDKVLVEILDRKSSNPNGRVLDVLESAHSSKVYVCTLESHDNQVMRPINDCISKIYTPFCTDRPNYIAVRRLDDSQKPENWKIEKFVRINEELRRNSLFAVKVLRWGKDFRYPLGVVVEVLPKVNSLDAGLKVLNIEHQLQRNIPLCVQREATVIKSSTNTSGRRDLRNLTTFSIDSANSQDIDDAISVTDAGQWYEIGVHIADVASFVAKDSKMDKYVTQHGVTFYPPEREPAYMFPKDLSTDSFSLLPGCDRRAISLVIRVDKTNDRIIGKEFFISIIRSDRKLSYEDVEDILHRSTEGYQDYRTLEGCLAVACHFAEVHRKDRKQEDWCYAAPDEDEVLGNRRSHKMVEELMIMYNHFVAVTLLSDTKTKNHTPLRCQDRPDRDQLKSLFERYRHLIPMSIHLSCQMAFAGNETNVTTANQYFRPHTVSVHQELSCPSEIPFTILKALLQDLEIAAQEKDVHRIVDLITTDDIHPQLLPLVKSLRKIIGRAQTLRSNSTRLSKTGHHDLELDCYAWASSPIRRYVDIIVQRILHSVLENTDVHYSANEIDSCCADFARRSENQSRFERKARSLCLASKLICQSAKKVGYIEEVAPAEKLFRLSFPLHRQKLDIHYRDLQITDQPKYDEQNNCMVLRWMRRVYSFNNECIQKELEQQESNTFTTLVPSVSWKNLLSAIQKENWDYVPQILRNIRETSNQRYLERANTPKTDVKNEHYVELRLKLKPGETLEVQLGTDTERGLLVPSVQLLTVRPKFDICLEHTKHPTMCFSKFAIHSSKNSYTSYMEYMKIWRPMCDMETAVNAVAENESIVLEDTLITWEPQKQDRNLEGNFSLPLDKIKQWAIGCDLRNCFLCIRMRHHKDNHCAFQADSNIRRDSDSTALTNVPSVIWVAHGITSNVTDEEEAKVLQNKQVDFYINHMSVTTIPDHVFDRDTRFTVELIPKLLPDVRKENAVEKLTKANQLVKDIATGKTTRCTSTQTENRQQVRFDIKANPSLGFQDLNNSQNIAIREAINNRFTLIQGPPGTGKTVVGVHIVYWFFKKNQTMTSYKKQTPDEDTPKKRCILFCGPSNKSVDVVAGQLLKLKGFLKPLRMYSEQTEMREFPYPGSSLKLSRKSARGERPNQVLRSITLHHLIRQPGRLHCSEIQQFDERIQRGEALTEEEVMSYKDVLNKAKTFELLQHDVILCTCSAASNRALAKVLSFPQIIIDECAMATEPEAFIPLVTHKPEQIVLIGDHKQLRPIVRCDVVKRLGMEKSLFERNMDKALMLDTQYRMHEDICKFPSMRFYFDKLKTEAVREESFFQNNSQKPTSIIFGHVEGKEISLMVATEQGNENSKANVEEAKETVRVAGLLIQAGIKETEIAILTPYNAQVAKISETLRQYGILNVTVSTIMISQGSEWRYVILSTVRSWPVLDTGIQVTRAWLLRRLGFVIDQNQMNVGITRAQDGLCIIGNANLLRCSPLWCELLNHYQEKDSVVTPASNIQIVRRSSKKNNNRRSRAQARTCSKY